MSRRPSPAPPGDHPLPGAPPATRRVRHRRAAVAAALAAGVLFAGASATATTNWPVPLRVSSAAQGRSTTPAAPTSVRATCVSSTGTTVQVTWGAVTHATSYSVYESKTAGTYTKVATSTTTSWTSSALTSGIYTFKVAASIGTKWSGPRSSASTTRTINANKTTCK